MVAVSWARVMSNSKAPMPPLHVPSRLTKRTVMPTV